MKAAEINSLWIVIPAFNEEKRLPILLEKLVPQYPNVIVVNDGSSDATLINARLFPIVVVDHEKNKGQGAALRTGIQKALEKGASIVVTFDADGQHRIEDIEKMVHPLLNLQADITLGSRFLGSSPGIPLKRKFILKCAILFTRIFSGISLTDSHNGFRGLNRKAAEKIKIHFDGPEHASEILHQIRSQNLKYLEVPVLIQYSPESLAKSPKGWIQGFKIALNFIGWRIFNSTLSHCCSKKVPGHIRH
jgi:glycosyltransferase involved in cell wall biosynthesis